MVVNGKADDGGIAPTTQEKVRKAMREVGYVPDAAARSLRGGRNGLIGVHTFERVFPVGRNDYYHEFLVGIEEKAVEVGQDLVLFASTQRPDGTRSIYGTGANRLRLADGAIILGLERNDEELERLAGEGFPFVFIGRRNIAGTQVPYVAADYASALADVVSELAALGHTSVSYLGDRSGRGPQQERRAAFVSHSREAGLDPAEPVLTTPDAVTADWLSGLLGTGSTALVIETYELADGVAAAAAALGCPVPEALSVVCLDVPPTASEAAGWSHVAVPRRELGAQAVTILIGLLDGEVAADHHKLVACEPMTPGTVAPPRATPVWPG